MSYVHGLVALILIFVQTALASCPGCVELDEITFGKLIPKFQYSLIKFDIAFPYGEKHEAFSEFAKTISPAIDDLLVGLVGIKDYGERDNSQLAERYQIDEKNYPVIILFSGTENEKFFRYPADRPITSDNLKQFVRDSSGLYIGLDGCLKDYDLLVKGFADRSLDEQKELVEKAIALSELLDNEKDKDQAKVYIVMMSKIVEKGRTFIDDERRRLENLRKAKLSESRMLKFTQRLNILQSFQTDGEESAAAPATKDEF